ncbi:MAG TPA: glycine zipper family protein [Stellaceae bacterium]
MTPRFAAILAAAPMLAAILAGCAGGDPVIDTRGVDQTRYRQDLADCRTYTDSVSTGGRAASGAAGTALLGAALGAVTGAVTGDPGAGAAIGAGTGGIFGGASGAGNAAGEKGTIVRNCLRNRGYAVLD